MKRSERKLWQSATTLVDLGELTALWLSRRIKQHPGYPGRQGPDPETSAIAMDLIALNRAGFVTSSSQPGRVDGEYRQRAAVEGFTTPEIARRLQAISGGQVHVTVHWGRPPKRTKRHAIIPVSMYGDRIETEFGPHLSADDIALLGVSSEARQSLCDAVQVTVVGLDWGENTVWAKVRDALNIPSPFAVWPFAS